MSVIRSHNAFHKGPHDVDDMLDEVVNSWVASRYVHGNQVAKIALVAGIKFKFHFVRVCFLMCRFFPPFIQ